MAKTKLFDLIQSMSMSEKRFFKIFSSRHVIGKENDYVKLFDLIDKMNEFDEQAVRAANFVKNSSAEKNFLYGLILRSLTTFHNQASSKIKVYDYLISIEILFNKGLYNQCQELINKAKLVAESNELFRQLLMLKEIEQEVLLKDLDYNKALESIKNDKAILDRVNNIADITYLTTKGYHENLSIGVARAENQLDNFKELLKHPFLKNAKDTLSKRARLHQMSLAMTYNMIAGNTGKVVSGASEIITFYETNDFLIEYTPIGYVSSNFILGAALRDSNEIKKALTQANILKEASENKFVNKSQKAKAIAFYYHAILKIQLLLKQNDFDEALNFFNEIEVELNQHNSFISKPQLYDLYFQFCKLFFVINDYKRTLKYTNEILNDLKFKERDDFSITVRLFNLIVHFELDNDFTLEYLSKSTYSYLKRKDKLYQVEKGIIKFLENYYKFEENQTVTEELLALDKSFKSLSKDKFEVGAFRLFDFRYWIESKLNGKSVAEVV